MGKLKSMIDKGVSATGERGLDGYTRISYVSYRTIMMFARLGFAVTRESTKKATSDFFIFQFRTV